MKALSVCGERQDTHSSVCDLSREIVCLSLYLWLCLHLQIAFIFIFCFDLWSCLLLGLSVKRTSLDPFQFILCCYGWALICREVMNMYLILVDSFLWYMASWDYSLLWGPGISSIQLVLNVLDATYNCDYFTMVPWAFFMFHTPSIFGRMLRKVLMSVENISEKSTFSSVSYKFVSRNLMQ